VLPPESVCLSVPVVPPSEYEDRGAERQRHDAGRLRTFELTSEQQH
jgi:hypothetical protein